MFSEDTAAPGTSNRTGSLRWMAPELHQPKCVGLDSFKRTPATDIYAFAIVCIEARTFQDR
jgi:serine/threonine protein kinase